MIKGGNIGITLVDGKVGEGIEKIEGLNHTIEKRI